MGVMHSLNTEVDANKNELVETINDRTLLESEKVEKTILNVDQKKTKDMITLSVDNAASRIFAYTIQIMAKTRGYPKPDGNGTKE